MTTPQVAPPPPDELQALLASYRSSIDKSLSVDERALHMAICGYVQQLKAAELPPERVLATIKAVALRSGIPLSLSGGYSPKGPSRPSLMDTIVSWCIREYFRAGDACIPAASPTPASPS